MRLEAMQETRTQARIGCQRPVLGKPLRECARTHAQAEAFFDIGDHSPACLPAVVAHKRIEDHREGKGFALGNLRGEDPVAVMASPELDGLQLFVAFAFPGEAGAPAVEASLALIADELLAG